MYSRTPSGGILLWFALLAEVALAARIKQRLASDLQADGPCGTRHQCLQLCRKASFGSVSTCAKRLAVLQDVWAAKDEFDSVKASLRLSICGKSDVACEPVEYWMKGDTPIKFSPFNDIDPKMFASNDCGKGQWCVRVSSHSHEVYYGEHMACVTDEKIVLMKQGSVVPEVAIPTKARNMCDEGLECDISTNLCSKNPVNKNMSVASSMMKLSTPCASINFEETEIPSGLQAEFKRHQSLGLHRTYAAGALYDCEKRCLSNPTCQQRYEEMRRGVTVGKRLHEKLSPLKDLGIDLSHLPHADDWLACDDAEKCKFRLNGPCSWTLGSNYCSEGTCSDGLCRK